MVKSTMIETCSAVLRSRRNCSSDGAERTDDGRAFHARAAVTEKARSPMRDMCIKQISNELHLVKYRGHTDRVTILANINPNLNLNLDPAESYVHDRYTRKKISVKSQLVRTLKWKRRVDGQCDQWRLHTGAGGTASPPPNRCQAPKFSRTLDTLWPIDSQKNQSI